MIFVAVFSERQGMLFAERQGMLFADAILQKSLEGSENVSAIRTR